MENGIIFEASGEVEETAICIGSLLEASTVLEKIGMSENENAKMLLLGEKEEITENGDWAEEKQIQISKEENSIYRMVGEKKKYLLITEPFQKLTGKAAYVISDQEILGEVWRDS